MERDQNQQPPVFVHPDVSPDAKSYQAAILARRQAASLPKVQTPVGGGPSPAIPRLDSPVQLGYTMEQMAQQQRVPQPQAGGIVEPAPAGGRTMPPRLNLTANDILPQQASQDPEFRQAMGSMLAMSQPNLAAKYGVLRNGKFIPPQQLVPANQPQLRQETMRDLKELESLMAQQQGNKAPGLPNDEAESDRKVAEGPAGIAARIGNSPGDESNRPLTEAETERLKDKISQMDDFDFDTFRQSMMKDILNNPEQQKIIESRLKPLDITDMIVEGFVTQKVVIIPGKLSFTFRSLSGETEVEIKRMIMEETKSLDVSDRYLLDRYAFMTVTAGLIAINDKPMGDVVNKEGDFEEESFRKKLKRILKLPLHMLASIGLNQMWFEQRARRLYVAEKVGNG